MKGNYQLYRNYYRFWFPVNGKKKWFYSFRGRKIYAEQDANQIMSDIRAYYRRYLAGESDFDLDAFMGKGHIDSIQFCDEWLEAAKKSISQATYCFYRARVNNYIKPYFAENPVQLVDITEGVLDKLLIWIDENKNVSATTKHGVMRTLHRMLKYAKRCRKIQGLPEFPEKSAYRFKKRMINVITRDRQTAIINAADECDRPILQFLALHMRRPSEACALKWEDYDEINQAVLIRRSISSGKERERTKTGKEHYIPLHDAFIPTIRQLKHNRKPDDVYIFINPKSIRRASSLNRYTIDSVRAAWNRGAKRVGETINLYNGTKHTSCTDMINNAGLSFAELQIVTDHSDIRSLYHYAETSLVRKRELLNTRRDRDRGSKVVNFNR